MHFIYLLFYARWDIILFLRQASHSQAQGEFPREVEDEQAAH
jgi:hypothetical protein